MKMWPFPLLRNYGTSPLISELLLQFAEHPEMQVISLETHYARLKCPAGEIEFWNANKYYAWAKSGVYRSAAGLKLTWEDEMPSRWVVRRLSRAINSKTRALFVAQ